MSDAADRIMNLLTYAALLSEPGAPETPERMEEIHKVVHEVAHEMKKGRFKWHTQGLSEK